MAMKKGAWTGADQRKNPRKLVLREKRLAAELTLADVAKHLDISQHQYSRYELNPERLRRDQLAKLSRLFDCTIEELVDDGQNAIIDPIAGTRRTLPVFSMLGRGTQMGSQVGTIAPRSAVSVQAYAVAAPDDSMADTKGPRAIHQGDWCVVDPAEAPAPGDVVHAVDPHTGAHLLRFFIPLHPTNPRAPGFVLRAASAAHDEIYVSAKDAKKVVRGKVVERHTLY